MTVCRHYVRKRIDRAALLIMVMGFQHPLERMFEKMTPAQLRGTKTCRSITTTMSPIAIPTTARGLILTPFSFSVSKYLIRPAEDWNPESFFFAMGLRYLRSL